MLANVSTHSIKVLVNIIVAVSQYANAQESELSVSLCIFLFVHWSAVLYTVNFNGDSFFCNKKVKDIVSDIFLPVYGKGEMLEKIIPDMLFFGGHIFSKCLCNPRKRRIVFVAHLTPRSRRPRQGIAP